MAAAVVGAGTEAAVVAVGAATAAVVAAVVMEAEAEAVGVIEHSILPQGQEAFSTGLLDRPAPIIAHRVFFPDEEPHRSASPPLQVRRSRVSGRAAHQPNH